MSNHPNRGWRRRAITAAEDWLGTFAATIAAPRQCWDAVRDLARRAYLDGYAAGRESTQRQPRPDAPPTDPASGGGQG